MTLTVSQHNGGYSARTKYNAAIADLTVAFAADFTTAGEKLTRKAAGAARYLPIPLIESSVSTQASMLLYLVRHLNVYTLNIAGNGIYTLSRYGWDQERINDHVFRVIKTAHAGWHLNRVISGGQTGIDIAGVTAAYTLEVPQVDVIMPKGFMQRTENGQDVYLSAEAVRKQITDGANNLRKIVCQ